MSKFLFAAQPGMGHLNPMFAIGRHLVTGGHEVTFVFAGPASVREAIAGRGFRVVEIPPAAASIGLVALPLFSGFAETAVAMRSFFAGLSHYARLISKVIQQEKSDAVVADFAFPGAGLAADLAAIPHVSVYSAGLCFPGPGIPPFGSGLPIGQEWGFAGRIYTLLEGIVRSSIERAVTSARRNLGLPPVDVSGYRFVTSPWLTLFLTVEALEATRTGLPQSAYFIGPCFAGREPGAGSSFSWDTLSDTKPKIYVSLGTFFNNKPHVYRRIIQGLATGRHQIIVSAGGAYSALARDRLPEDVLLFERVPQVELLRRVDAVVSHGGNNTVNETLSAGRPLLVMPVGGEQGDNAARVEYLGAGLRARIRSSSAGEIGDKVRRLLEERPFAERAREISAAIACTDGPVVAARCIERLVRTGRPLVRPSGCPLTIAADGPPPWET